MGTLDFKMKLYDYRMEAPFFQVPEDDPNYSSEDGVLFNKDKTRLLRFPTETDRKEYVVPDGVERIEEFSFAYCGLETLDLNQVRRAGRAAFSECSNLTDLRLGSRLETISEMMAYACYNLKSLEIPQSVKAIENYGMARCDGLKEITIPKSVGRISPYPFGFLRGKVVHLEANGAVLYMRDEFPGTGDPKDPVNFRKYDGNFYRMDAETRMMAAFYRLAYPVELSDQWELEYRGFLRRRSYEMTEKLIREDDSEGIRFLAEKGVIYKDNIDDVIRRAGDAGRVSITACLLQYKNQNYRDLDDLFSL